jgi:4-hydroxyphenylpyruvate dioxygenase-like putative hemolysin
VPKRWTEFYKELWNIEKARYVEIVDFCDTVRMLVLGEKNIDIPRKKRYGRRWR